MIGDIWRRLQLMLGQGRVSLVSDETVQAQVLDEETLKAVRVEPYGMSYRPQPGSHAYLVFPSGDRALGIALVIADKRYEMALELGEVALHDDEGNCVKLGRGGNISVKAAGMVTIEASSGLSIKSGGAVAIESASLTHNGKNVGASHTHTGVVVGGATTGAVS